MDWHGVYIDTGASLAPLLRTDHIVAAGAYPAENAAKTQQLSVSAASPDDAAPDFAVRAARAALARAGRSAAEVNALFYHYSIHPGVDVHNSAGYVARELGIPAGPVPLQPVAGGCHSGLAAVELAAARLQVYRNNEVVLVTGADVAPAPVIDRWSGAEMPLGDGAGAGVLTRSGRYRLVSTATASDSAVEQMHRGAQPFGPGRIGPDSPIDIPARISHFRATMSREELIERIRNTVTTCIDEALGDADAKLADMDHVVLPYVGAHIRDRTYRKWLDLTDEQVHAGAVDAQQLGHVTTSDPLISLDRLIDAKALRPAQRALIVADGAGFVCCAMVVEAVE